MRNFAFFPGRIRRSRRRIVTTKTPLPVLAGFPSSTQEGTTVTGQMTRESGGDYAPGTVFEFRSSNNGGSSYSSWATVTGSTAVRLLGAASPYTVQYDVPFIAGNSDTNHQIQLRATESGSTLSDAGTSGIIVGTAVTDLDTTVDDNLIPLASVQAAFGFSRHVSGYSGNTCRLRRVSDNAELDFTFDATGRFALTTVLIWRGTSAVNFVGFYDQRGSGKTLAASGTTPFCDASGGVLRHAYDWSSEIDDTAGQLTLSNTEGGIGIPLGGSNHLVLTNSGFTVSEGFEVYLSASHRERVATTASAQPTVLGNTTTQKFLMSYGVSTTNELQIRMGSSTEMSVYRQGTTSQANIGVPPNGFTKKNSYRVRSMGLDATNFWGRHLGRMTITAANAGNQSSVSALANGTLRIGSNFAGSGTGCQQLVSAVIVTKTLTNAQRFVLESRLANTAFQHLAMPVSSMVDLFDEWLDWRDISGNPQTGARTVSGKKSKLTLNVLQSADWTHNFTIPQNGLTGLRRTNMTTTSAYFEATTNYLTDATEVTAFQFFFEEGDQGSSNIWDYWSLAASRTDFSRVAFELGRDHAGPRMMTTVDPALDPNDRSATQFIATTTNPDQVLGGWSQPMGKYALKLTGHGITSPYTTAAAGTTAGIYGAVTIPIGTVINNAYMQSTFNVYPGTPELRRWSDTSTTGNAALPYIFANSNAAGQNALQFVAATSKKNPLYDFTTATENLVRTATNTLYASPFQGTMLGSMDSDVAIAPGSGPHMKAPSTFKICSTSYQGAGRHPQGVYLITAFAKTPLTMRQIQAVQANLYKVFTQGYA